MHRRILSVFLAFLLPLAFAAADDFVLVDFGSFYMGSNDGYENERPVHKVFLSSFYICTHEVTQAEYEAVMGRNPSHFKGGKLPVERVSWYDAVEYCNRRSEAEGLELCYTGSRKKGWTCDFSANGYRLPTEAEWEFAARGGAVGYQTLFSGSNTIGRVAWYGEEGRNAKTHEVMTKAPNELGLYDMSGNVWEWCWGCVAPYGRDFQVNPTGAEFEGVRILRGGCYYNGKADCTVSRRGASWPEEDKESLVGFRVVRSRFAR